MLSKKCLFGGGLCLGNAVAIFTSISGDVIAQDDIRQARNQLNQIWWRITANNLITNPSLEEEHAWIKDGNYWDSIVKVIGKAIGDCVTEEGAFKGTSAKNIITFEDTNPADYERKHWNAVILYNYVNKMIRSAWISPPSIEECFTEVSEHYLSFKSIKKARIASAMNDIKKYCAALHLDKLLLSVRESVQDWNKIQLNLENSKFFYSDKEMKAAELKAKNEALSSIVPEGIVTSKKNKKTYTLYEFNDEGIFDSPKFIDESESKFEVISYKPIFGYQDGELFVSKIEKHKVVFTQTENNESTKTNDDEIQCTLDDYNATFKLLDGLTSFLFTNQNAS